MNIIIPLCGKGERFVKKGFLQQKPLIRVLEKELILHVLDSLKFSDEDRVYIIINKRIADTNLETLVKSKYGNIMCICLEQETAGASETIWRAVDHFQDSSCLLIDGDNFYTTDIISEIRKNPDMNQVVCFETHGELVVFSYIQSDSEGNINTIREKEKISEWANTGAYYFASRELLKKTTKAAIDAATSEPYISHAIAVSLAAGDTWRKCAIPANSYFSLGTPEQVDFYISRTYGFLFDLDGTLVNTDTAYYQVWSEILAEYNIFLTKEIFDTYIYSNDDASVKKKLLSGVPITTEELSAKKDTLFLKYINTITVLPNALQFIAERRKEAHKIAVVTNANRKTAEAILKQIDLQPDCLIIGGECEAAKPSPAPYKNAAEYLHIPTQKCVVFEDSKNGIASAVAAGVKCIVGISRSNLHSVGADLVFPDFFIPLKTLLEFERPKENFEEVLTKSLRHRGVKNIRISPIQLKGGFIADVMAVEMEIGGVHKKAVFKRMNENESPLNKMAHFLDLYGRENYFYETIAPFVPVCVPDCYGLVRDSDFKPIGFVLEDLRDSAVLNRDLCKESIDVSLSVISHMAKLHAAFWNKDLTLHFSNLRKHDDPVYKPAWGDFLEKRLELFIAKWKLVMAPRHIELAQKIVGSFADIQTALSTPPLTLTHGDIKSPNIFYRGDIPYFIDWQYIANGKGVQDLVFFMIESFNQERIVHLYPLFKSYYYQKLFEYGVKDYSFEAYEKDLEIATYHFPFFVALWFGTTPNSDLIDVNFPYFYIQRLFAFYDLVLGDKK